jgi:hypothetical protein
MKIAKRERWNEDEIWEFQSGNRAIKWVPVLYSKVIRAFVAEGSDIVDGVALPKED